MIKNVLFDLDGTLTDPAEGITKSVAFALDRFGIYVSDLSVLNVFIGPPLTDSFKKYFDFTDEQAKFALDTYREYFSVYGLYENEVYKGIPEMLGRLQEKGIRVCLATSKPEKYSVKILEHFDLKKYFYFIAGNTMDETRSRKDLLIKHIFDSNPDFKPEETIMVGDRIYDIEGAHDFGIKAIGVSYGYAPEGELEASGADIVVENVEQLEKAIMNL